MAGCDYMIKRKVVIYSSSLFVLSSIVLLTAYNPDSDSAFSNSQYMMGLLQVKTPMTGNAS